MAENKIDMSKLLGYIVSNKRRNLLNEINEIIMSVERSDY